jgi:3-hydroxyacyl-[acyl-carrier-protein] dehydratase
MWIDRVVELVPGEKMVAVKSVSLAEEHMHDHFAADETLGLPAEPVMPFSLMIEGMAQTAGILVGHAGEFREKVILAKIGKASLDEEPVPGQTIRYTATVERLDTSGASTKGIIELFDHAEPEAGYREIGRVDLLFSHIDNNAAGTVFPEHNFVFGEGFKTLLRTSGVLEPV